jgi:Uma2 family endonuclease
MSVAMQPLALYDRLLQLPENLTGEIMGGELYIQPRPAAPHALSASALGGELYGLFQKGRGGPGGWWIIDEPELHFVRDTEVLVPDIAGWRRERMPILPQDHRFLVIPDWICEILSPSTLRKDRVIKMKVYAHYGVKFLWLIDPLARILESYYLDNGHWTVSGLYQDKDEVSTPPFDAVVIALGDLWQD